MFVVYREGCYWRARRRVWCGYARGGRGM